MPMKKSKKIGVISLGCDKNRVDTEKMLAILSEKHLLFRPLLIFVPKIRI